MKYIELTKGKKTLVDDEDYEFINQHKWHLSSHGYAVRTTKTPSVAGKRHGKMIGMHRVILNTPSDMVVDHINGNKLDNRKSNLRNCTQAQNCQNQGLRRNNTSGYKGVHFHKQRINKWQARLHFTDENGKRKVKHLGFFDDPKEAGTAYNQAAQEQFGEFAKVNV